MIRLPDIALPDETQKLLAGFQAEVDAAGDFAAQVTEAQRMFSLKNKPTNPAFKVVRQKLNELCGGAERCCYCELSQADEVEHVRPKDWFPELVFAWSNYTYSCGPCNGPKNNQFAIFKRGARTALPLIRRRGDSVEAPPAGTPVLIDPRAENPLDFMELDLTDTFYFVPLAGSGTRDFIRAEYTIQILRLNERDVLPKARHCAFHAFRAILGEVAAMTASGASASDIALKRSVISQSPHPAVWQEMQRQRNNFQDLLQLFREVPEALDW